MQRISRVFKVIVLKGIDLSLKVVCKSGQKLLTCLVLSKHN